MGDENRMKFGTIHNMVFDKENIKAPSSTFQTPSSKGYFMKNNFMKKDLTTSSAKKAKYSFEKQFYVEVVQSEIRSSSFFRGADTHTFCSEKIHSSISEGPLGFLFQFKGMVKAERQP